MAARHRGGFPAPGAEDFFFAPISVFGHSLSWKIGGVQLGINRVVLLEFLAAAILIVVFAWAVRRPKVVPRGMQNFVEATLDLIRKELVDDVIGHEGRRFFPYLAALFLFIWLSNLFEIIPGLSFPINSRTAMPVAFAIITLVLFVYQGFKNQGARYPLNVMFPPGIPKALYLLIAPIEFFSTFLLRPFTLFIRLSANMIAGHLILAVFFVATQYLLAGPLYGKAFTVIFGVGSLIASIAFVAFEFLVATLQAYIFTLLTSVYLAGALAPEH